MANYEKAILLTLAIIIIGFGFDQFYVAEAQPAPRVLTVPQGGTGAPTLPSGCLEGNGTSPITSTGVPCGSGSGSGGISNPFTQTTIGGTVHSATNTPMYFSKGLLAASSTLGQLVAGNITATSTATSTFAGGILTPYLHSSDIITATTMIRSYNFVLTPFMRAGDGNVTNPGYAFMTDDGTGVYRTTAGGTAINFGIAGANEFTITANEVLPTTEIQMYQADNAGAPGYTWDGEEDTGMFLEGANEVGISTGGTSRFFIDGNGLIDFKAYDCTGNDNGGVLTADGSGNVVCDDDDSSAGGGGSNPFNVIATGEQATSSTLQLTKGLIGFGSSTFAGLVNTGTINATSTITATGNITTAGRFELPNNSGIYQKDSGGDYRQVQFLDSGNALYLGGTTNINSIFFQNGGGSVAVLTTGGFLGIGTTTPGSILSVSGVGNFTAGTSTLYSGLQVANLRATSTVQAMNFSASSLSGCDTIDTDAAGNFKCGSDAQGAGGGSNPFNIATNFATNTAATGTSIWLRGGAYYASTSATSTFDAGFQAANIRSLGTIQAAGITSSGYVNINATAPTLRLESATNGLSSIKFNENPGSVDYGGYIKQDGSANFFSIGYLFNGTEQPVLYMSEGNLGNLGIGTTSPSSILSIQSVANFSAATSTLYSGLLVPVISASSTSASSTFQGVLVNTFHANGSLRIPFGTGVTVDKQGMLALDTTDNQIIIGTSTDPVGVIRTKNRLFGTTVASTSVFMNGAVGKLLPVPTETDGMTVFYVRCHVVSGTSVVFNLTDGTNDTQTVTCTTTSTEFVITTNNVWTAGEVISLERGAVTGTVDYLTISAFGVYTRE